ncbi:MAG: tRNA (adenosine(37)-N6)-threonylcarbamoyltransferase complex dimerization subunit type 1 TsaB, partial [Lachnospiraceae bacterium]|nr:tRNA (adenosine(37)-N6)-threonylcarbamoyltransferase complex dimerization subunit type 1 TsaB [Lachnospiraceae bacterium]
MKILAIDSSGLVASAAIWEGASAAVTGSILATASTDYKKTHSQTLLPMIDRICRETDSKPGSFDAV